MPNEKHRLFVALWPDDAIRQQIKSSALNLFLPCDGRVIPRQNWHITLAYFGMANESTQVCISKQLANVQSQSFNVHLNKTGYWPKPAVAWLGPDSVTGELQQLFDKVQHALQPCGYTPDTRPYQPHVTLVRKAKHLPKDSAFAAIEWQVNHFCLVESRTGQDGAEYHVIKSWPLS